VPLRFTHISTVPTDTLLLLAMEPITLGQHVASIEEAALLFTRHAANNNANFQGSETGSLGDV
jgi:hypothetical protein